MELELRHVRPALRQESRLHVPSVLGEHEARLDPAPSQFLEPLRRALVPGRDRRTDRRMERGLPRAARGARYRLVVLDLQEPRLALDRGVDHAARGLGRDRGLCRWAGPQAVSRADRSRDGGLSRGLASAQYNDPLELPRLARPQGGARQALTL